MSVPRTRFRHPRAIWRACKGIAAVEAALIAPILFAIVLAILELSLRYRAYDAFHRYLFQAGDYLAREEQLVAGDITQIYQTADDLMAPLQTSGLLDLDVSSIGFKLDGTPELLWRRHRGTAPPSIDVSQAAGLGKPGESVVRVGVTYRYTSPITSMIGGDGMTLSNSLFFRPRVTRLIAIDGAIHDAGADWPGSPPGGMS